MRGRPAESLAGTSSIGLLIAYVLGVDDPDLIVCLGAVVGLVPAVVTLLVDGGGVSGVLRKLWRGRS
jgi:hypothetical protein